MVTQNSTEKQIQLVDLYDIGLEKCPFLQLKAAMIEFPFHVPVDEKDEIAEAEEPKEEEAKYLQWGGAPPPVVYDTVSVDGKLIKLVTHDSVIIEFTYYGMVRVAEGDPHGPGVAFCNFNRQHCYMGMWEQG